MADYSGHKVFASNNCDLDLHTIVHLNDKNNFRMTLITRNNITRQRKVSFTRPFSFSEQFIAIPPGEEYDGYEKLILPFDDATWMWLGVTFLAAFGTIFVLNFVPPDIKNFIIGRETITPALNVLRAFFGISHIVCPGRNFARFLMISFIWFSFIIRTGYQGKMFEFLQQEIR